MSAEPPEPGDPAPPPPAVPVAGPGTGVVQGKGGRAGRDLPAAIAVGLGLVALIVVPLFIERAAFAVILALVIGIAVHELTVALRGTGVDPPLVPLLVGSAATVLGAYWGGADAALGCFLVSGLVVLAWRLVLPGSGAPTRDAAAGMLVLGYCGFLASFCALLTAPADGPRRVLAFIATVVFSDIGGYVVGVLTGGRHKLAPGISPGKSWEGLGGSIASCVLVGVGCMTLLLHRGAWTGVVLGVALAATAVLGDLGESALKRDIGIKDMGTLLPGHGGILDRLDSLLASAPVAWIVISALAPH